MMSVQLLRAIGVSLILYAGLHSVVNLLEVIASHGACFSVNGLWVIRGVNLGKVLEAVTNLAVLSSGILLTAGLRWRVCAMAGGLFGVLYTALWGLESLGFLGSPFRPMVGRPLDIPATISGSLAFPVLLILMSWIPRAAQPRSHISEKEKGSGVL